MTEAIFSDDSVEKRPKDLPHQIGTKDDVNSARHTDIDGRGPAGILLEDPFVSSPEPELRGLPRSARLS